MPAQDKPKELASIEKKQVDKSDSKINQFV